MAVNVEQVITEAQLTVTGTSEYHKIFCVAERAGLPARAVAHEAAVKLGFDGNTIQALEAWYAEAPAVGFYARDAETGEWEAI